MNIKQIKEREQFLLKYAEFDKWLLSIGFRTGHYWKECTTYMDCHYSHYDNIIDSLYSVEHFIHDILNFSIRFLRDRNEHKFIIVGKGYTNSDIILLEDLKKLIILELLLLKNKKLNELNSIELK